MSHYDNFNPIDRAALEQMTLDELYEIIDASYEPGVRISADTVLEVLKEIENREGKIPSPTLDAAWENIKKEHLHPVEHGAEAEHETDIENVQSIEPKTKKSKKILPRIVGIAVALAIVLFAAGSLIPQANGSNLWSAFIAWTKEAFGYMKTGEEKRGEIPDQLQELRDLIRDHGVPASELLPTYIPEGYEAVDTRCDERENATVFTCMLQNGTDSIMLQYRLLKNGEATTEYQKNEGNPEEYIVQDLHHYLVDNLNLFTATWSNGNMECAIQNVPSREELIQMIDSIYERT